MRLPGYAQVIALPGTARRLVPPEFGDANGHLNVRHYLALYDDAEWEIFERMGLGVEHARTDRRGMFALEQHLTYALEVDVGAEVSVHMRLLARSAKVVHLVNYLADHTRGQVAGAIEVVDGYADLDTRRLTAFHPGPGLAALDAQLAADRGLDWRPATSGCLAVRPERLDPAEPT
jgi:acyl-CoA thioester hydrolase